MSADLCPVCGRPGAPYEHVECYLRASEGHAFELQRSEPIQLVMANPWHRGGPATIADLELSIVPLPIEYGIRPPLRIAWVWERGDNPGVSITNGAEYLYLQVQGAAGPCYVVECYGSRSYALRMLRERETFDLVTIGADAEPSWRRLGTSREEAIEKLLEIVGTTGDPFPELFTMREAGADDE